MDKLTDLIRDLVRQLVAGELEDCFHLRQWAAQHGALPVLADMGGCFAITLSGEVVSFPWDEQNPLSLERNPRLCRLALNRGAQLYPVLRAFVPTRPADAQNCRHCEGTGRVKHLSEELAEVVVCYCGGLGWLRPGDTT